MPKGGSHSHLVPRASSEQSRCSRTGVMRRESWRNCHVCWLDISRYTWTSALPRAVLQYVAGLRCRPVLLNARFGGFHGLLIKEIPERRFDGTWRIYLLIKIEGGTTAVSLDFLWKGTFIASVYASKRYAIKSQTEKAHDVHPLTLKNNHEQVVNKEPM
jgi:hypothetical protein